METFRENDTLDCKKGVGFFGVAFCMICPAVMNDEDSINNDSTLPQSLRAKYIVIPIATFTLNISQHSYIQLSLIEYAWPIHLLELERLSLFGNITQSQTDFSRLKPTINHTRELKSISPVLFNGIPVTVVAFQ